MYRSCITAARVSVLIMVLTGGAAIFCLFTGRWFFCTINCILFTINFYLAWVNYQLAMWWWHYEKTKIQIF